MRKCAESFLLRDEMCRDHIQTKIVTYKKQIYCMLFVIGKDLIGKESPQKQCIAYMSMIL